MGVQGVDVVRHVIQMHFLAAVPKATLKSSVGHYCAQADEITRALDLLFQGY
jgi:hypothetical protein